MPLFNISSEGALPLAQKSKNGIQIYIRHDDRAKPLDHRIALACCRYYTDEGATALNIARQSRLSRNTVRKALKALAKSGDVSKSTSGKWTASEFETGHKGFKVRMFPELSKYEYCVLALIRSWAKGKSSFVSQQGIATQLAVDPRTVYKAVKSLVENDWIERRGRSFRLLGRTLPDSKFQPIAKKDDNAVTEVAPLKDTKQEPTHLRKPDSEDIVANCHRRILAEAESIMRKAGIPEYLAKEQLSLLDQYGIEIWDGWKACFNEAKSKHRPKKQTDPKHCGHYLRGIVNRLTATKRFICPSADSMFRGELLDHLRRCGTDPQLAMRIACKYPAQMTNAVRKRLLSSTTPLLTDDLTMFINDAA